MTLAVHCYLIVFQNLLVPVFHELYLILINTNFWWFRKAGEFPEKGENVLALTEIRDLDDNNRDDHPAQK